jgi:hypothetical protein
VPQMKILIASRPPQSAAGDWTYPGHRRPPGCLLIGSVFRDRILAIGSSFHAFPAGADFDPSVPSSVASELESITPGADWLRVAMERMFVDAVPAQHQGLQKVLQNFPADVVIGDDMLFGVFPMLLGPDAKRPPIVLCGTSFLHWCRGDGAPHFIGLPPAITQAQRDEYAQIYQDHDRQIYRPVADRLNRHLEKIGVEPLSMTLFDSIVYIQLTVPSFEFPREIPSSVHFVGTPPIVPEQAPLPPWAHELDGSRKVVLVTTVGNHNFDLSGLPCVGATIPRAVRSHGSLGVRPKSVRSSAENGSAVRSQIAVTVASLWSNVEYPCHKPAERTRRCCAPMYVQPRCHNYTRRRIP